MLTLQKLFVRDAFNFDTNPSLIVGPDEDFSTVIQELEKFDARLIKRPQILVANKIDLLGKDSRGLEKLESLARKKRLPFFAISALRKEGIRPLISALARELEKLRGQTESS